MALSCISYLRRALLADAGLRWLPLTGRRINRWPVLAFSSLSALL